MGEVFFWWIAVLLTQTVSGRKSSKMLLTSKIPWGETVWVIPRRGMSFSDVLVNVWRFYFYLCCANWREVYFETKKVSLNVNDVHILVYMKLALQCEQVLEHFNWISVKTLLAFQESTTLWQGTSNSFGWFILMTHYLDVLSSNSSLFVLFVVENTLPRR